MQPNEATLFTTIDLWRNRFAWLIGIILSVLAIYTAGFGAFEDIYQRSVAVGMAALILLLFRPVSNDPDRPDQLKLLHLFIDFILILAILVATIWFFHVHDELETGLYDLTDQDMIVAYGGLVVLLELTRRTMGMPLLILGILSLIYCLFGEALPSIFTHAGYELEETIRTMWYSFDGVFGLPVSVVANMIAVFVVFGVVLDRKSVV